MIRDFRNEVWKEVDKEDYNPERVRIFVSNYGRVKGLRTLTDTYYLKKQGIIHNFSTSTYPRKGKRTKSFYVHKMVADLFLEKQNDEQQFVIHLDHNLLNNHLFNLKLVSREELTIHQNKNPKVHKAREERRRKGEGLKLTSTKVKLIKRKINDPNRKTRMKMIAKQFGISEMQLYRIKTGENWGYVTED